MKRILDAKYSKAGIKYIAESSTHLDPQERNELYRLLGLCDLCDEAQISDVRDKTYCVVFLWYNKCR